MGSWDLRCLQGLQHWEAGDAPFTAVAAPQAATAAVAPSLTPLGAYSDSPTTAAAAGFGWGGECEGAALQSALRALGSARRGLIVAAELPHPEDAVAAAQLSRLLGWPVAADVLSGLRAGTAAAAAAGSELCVVHHFDQLLLLEREQWRALRPDVVLHLGGHLTSKRVAQFLEWCCLDASSSGGQPQQQQQQQQQGLTWIHAGRSPKRHDQSHLLTHRLQAPLPLLAAAVAQHLAAAGFAGSDHEQLGEQRHYRRLLQLLDVEASAAVDAALQQMPELTEPAVARALSQQLPPGG